MKKTITFLMLISLLTFVAGCSITIENKDQVGENTQIEKVKEKTEKIEIVLIHGTVRCYSCNTMEELTKKTIEENFKDDFNSGKITFKAVNGEDPKNREIVNQYKATGLSIFINDIENGEDNIQEEKNLWRYIGNEEQFKDYLTKILNNLLDNN